jgi:hypothetical protein
LKKKDQNYENDNEDELTSMCCDFLAKSFNLTSSIARLLIINLTRLNNVGSNQQNAAVTASDKCKSIGGDESSKLILSDKNMRIALNVMNKLTANNRLFVIDGYIKQLVYFMVNKM